MHLRLKGHSSRLRAQVRTLPRLQETNTSPASAVDNFRNHAYMGWTSSPEAACFVNEGWQQGLQMQVASP